METCIHNHITMTPTQQSEDNATVSLRLRGSEAVRYTRVMAAVLGRNPYVQKTHVIRELLSLDPPTLITPAELEFFRTGKKGAAPDLDKRGVGLKRTERPFEKKKEVNDGTLKRRRTG